MSDFWWGSPPFLCGAVCRAVGASGTVFTRILKAAKIEKKGLHSFRHTFATRLVNGIKQADGTIRSLTPRQVADILEHKTSQITELYYVKKNTKRLSCLMNEIEL